MARGALVKGCNAVSALLCGSLRAGREAVARGVAPLGKDPPFPARRALRSTACLSTDLAAEHGKIKLKEYQGLLRSRVGQKRKTAPHGITTGVIHMKGGQDNQKL